MARRWFRLLAGLGLGAVMLAVNSPAAAQAPPSASSLTETEYRLITPGSQTLKLAQHISEHRSIQWSSRAGRPQHVYVDKLRTVTECFAYPEPDTSWMRNPPTREQFTAWMADR